MEIMFPTSDNLSWAGGPIGDPPIFLGDLSLFFTITRLCSDSEPRFQSTTTELAELNTEF